MNSKLISETHYNDLGLELVNNSEEVTVRLSRASGIRALFQGLAILIFVLLFVWHGFSEGYLLKVDRGLLVLISLVLLVAVIAPPALNFIRIKQVGGYVAKFDKLTRKFSCNYFSDVCWSDVSYFTIVSERLGEIVPFEIQVVLKDNVNFQGANILLVYPSSLRLDRGKMYNVFNEFARIAGKSLLVVR